MVSEQLRHPGAQTLIDTSTDNVTRRIQIPTNLRRVCCGCPRGEEQRVHGLVEVEASYDRPVGTDSEKCCVGTEELV